MRGGWRMPVEGGGMRRGWRMHHGLLQVQHHSQPHTAHVMWGQPPLRSMHTLHCGHCLEMDDIFIWASISWGLGGGHDCPACASP